MRWPSYVNRILTTRMTLFRLMLVAACAFGVYWVIVLIHHAHVFSLAKNGSIVVSVWGDPNQPNRQGSHDMFQLSDSEKDAFLSALEKDTYPGSRSMVHAEVSSLRVRLLGPQGECVGEVIVYGTGLRYDQLNKMARNGIPVTDFSRIEPGIRATRRIRL